jgi:hypothetical protein
MRNSHKIVAGAYKAKMPGTPSRTKSGKARSFFIYPPAEGWPGGRPTLNGARKD